MTVAPIIPTAIYKASGDNFEGINWYLKNYKSELKLITIATVEQKDIAKLAKEEYNKADFILVIDEDVTKTY